MATRKTAPTPPDPLADLREPEAPAGPPEKAKPAPKAKAPAPAEDAQPPAEDDARAPAEDDAQALEAVLEPDALTAIVAAWHRDRVTVGAIHTGGVCLCQHMARLAVATAADHLTIQAIQATEPPEAPADDEQGEGGGK